MSRHKLKDAFLAKGDGKFEIVLCRRNSDRFEPISRPYRENDGCLTNPRSAFCHFATWSLEAASHIFAVRSALAVAM
jgi:hypothetical protein